MQGYDYTSNQKGGIVKSDKHNAINFISKIIINTIAINVINAKFTTIAILITRSDDNLTISFVYSLVILEVYSRRKV